jgi:hypothetical protein
MIGVSFSWPCAVEMAFGVKDLPRFAQILPGEPFRGEPAFYWREWELPLKRRYEMADEITEIIGHRPREISGFTLFWNGDKRDGKIPSWQMSVRRKGEEGWDVQRIDQSQADAIFRLLESSGHPDGPWQLKNMPPVILIDAMVAPRDLKALLAAAERVRDAGTAILATYLPENA